MVDRGAVDLHIIKYASETDHACPGGGYLQTAEGRLIEGVLPFEGHQAVFMVAGGAQGAAIGQIVILEDQAVHGIGKLLRAIPGNGLLQSLF